MLALIASSLALSPTPVGRRAALTGATAALLAGSPAARAAQNSAQYLPTGSQEEAAIIERARKGDLNTARVFERARSNAFINPADIKAPQADCSSLRAIIDVNQRALKEAKAQVADASAELKRLNALAREDEGSLIGISLNEQRLRAEVEVKCSEVSCLALSLSHSLLLPSAPPRSPTSLPSLVPAPAGGDPRVAHQRPAAAPHARRSCARSGQPLRRGRLSIQRQV